MPKKTLEIVQATANDALIQVKGNQPGLLKALKSVAAATPPTETHSTRDIGLRNRDESRHASVWPLEPEATVLLKQWPTVRCLVRIMRSTDIFDTEQKIWKTRRETAWHICTRMLTAKEANLFVRKHWAIENSFHYVRDVTLGEDASRIRKRPGTFACLRSWALNLIRINQAQNVRAAREIFAWDAQQAWNCVNVF